MDAEHQRLLRAWQSNPSDLQTASALIRSARQRALPLPAPLDLEQVMEQLREQVQETYELMDGGGYVNQVAGAFLEGDPSGERERLFEAVRALSSEQLIHTCLSLLGVDAQPSLSFPCYVSGGKPELYAAFDALEARVPELLAPFQGLRVHSLNGDWPDDGEVYWYHDQLLVFPEQQRSYLLLIQYAW